MTEYLSIVVGLLSAISLIATIYMIIFKGAKKNIEQDHKIDILEKLWMLIFTDGRVDKFEDRLIRKISTLLGLEHGEMIAAKIKIKKILNFD